MSIQSELTRIHGELDRFEQLNTDLETVINSLPNAGGGGGGGSVETCSVEILADVPMMGGEAMFYTNASMVVVEDSMEMMDWMMGKTIAVVKGTILLIETTSPGWNITGSATRLVSSAGGATIFSINGDCSIMAA